MTMKSHFSRASMVAAAFGASAALLVGCGGSTVTSDDVESETTVAPLERSGAETTDADDSTDSEDREETTTQERPDGQGSAGVAAPPPPEDQGAREISEIPEAESPTSPEDEEYLSALTDADVDVAGLESSLVGTATTVCASEGGVNVTASAVAGQLIEQGRTELDHGELTELIEESARATYCP